jgi:hypothetical protein
MAHNILGFINTLKKEVNNLIQSLAKKFRAMRSECRFSHRANSIEQVVEASSRRAARDADAYLKNGVKTHSS